MKQGFHLLNTNYGRDYQAEQVADLTVARAGDACPECGTPMYGAFGYIVADRAGVLGMNALLCLAEKHHDERGLQFPFGMGPFDVHLLHLPSRGRAHGTGCRGAASALGARQRRGSLR